MISAVIETGTNHRSTTEEGNMNSAKEIGRGYTKVPFKLVLDFEQKFTRQRRKES